MTEQRNQVVIGDTFALRGGEIVQLRYEGVDGCVYAFMVAPVPPLPEPRHTTSSSGPVESACVVGAEIVNGRWQWMQLAPDTKEVIGNLLFDHGLERGVWHGAMIVSTAVPAPYGDAKPLAPKEAGRD